MTDNHERVAAEQDARTFAGPPEPPHEHEWQDSGNGREICVCGADRRRAEGSDE